jgi:hypothetical protein
VAEIWKTPPEHVSRIRSWRFRTENSFGNKTILLPDGRWLLGLDARTGRVVSVDLDSTQPTVEEVFHSDMDQRVGFHWEYWVDRSRQRLSVRLAVLTFCSYQSIFNFFNLDL